MPGQQQELRVHHTTLTQAGLRRPPRRSAASGGAARRARSEPLTRPLTVVAFSGRYLSRLDRQRIVTLAGQGVSVREIATVQVVDYTSGRQHKSTEPQCLANPLPLPAVWREPVL